MALPNPFRKALGRAILVNVSGAMRVHNNKNKKSLLHIAPLKSARVAIAHGLFKIQSLYTEEHLPCYALSKWMCTTDVGALRFYFWSTK